MLLVAALALVSSVATRADDARRTITADGLCERLVIAGEDRTAECGIPLLHYIFADGRMAVAAGTGGKSLFGLADPEELLMFSGTAEDSGTEWSSHSVDRVLISPAFGPPEEITSLDARGSCLYEASEGRQLLVHCTAMDKSGQRHELRYLTDIRTRFRF